MVPVYGRPPADYRGTRRRTLTTTVRAFRRTLPRGCAPRPSSPDMAKETPKPARREAVPLPWGGVQRHLLPSSWRVRPDSYRVVDKQVTLSLLLPCSNASLAVAVVCGW